MKKLLVFTVFLAMLLCGCGNSKADGSTNADSAVKNTGDEGKKKIVATIFPEYDWVREVLGDHADEYDLTLLLDNGVDLHSFQATSEDMVLLSSADLFIYVGGESDGWVEGALNSAENKNLATINLIETLSGYTKEEEFVEGMQEGEHHQDEDEDEDHHHDEDEDHDHDHEEEEVEYDEHVWLSLKRAQIVVDKIAEELAKLDPENADDYRANAKAYNEKLAALDAEYQQTVENATKKTLVFGDRFPFLYMASDYGLTYYAAFQGCSAETEASFETIAFLADKVDELELSAICTIEGDNHGIAETVSNTAKTKNLEMVEFNSLQMITKDHVENGTTYISVMEDNLEALKKALN